MRIRPPDRITPTLVKQYMYCPVIPWIQSWLMAEEPRTDSMEAGAELVGRGQVRISGRAGSAVLDGISRSPDGSLELVEVKAFASRNRSRYVAQAVTSYAIAREKVHGIRRARIVIGGKEIELELTADLVEDVGKVAEAVGRLLAREGRPPRPSDPSKCTSCWYKRYCPHA
ncbi:MAG: CRISPR-associated protein Cas4 [Desulfurococcaceae archaeon]